MRLTNFPYGLSGDPTTRHAWSPGLEPGLALFQMIPRLLMNR